MSLSLTALDGTRPYDWCWREAKEYADAGVANVSRRVDEYVTQAFKYLKEKGNPRILSNGSTEPAILAEKRAASNYPEIDKAYRLHSMALGDALRWGVEAMVLGRESQEAMAANAGLDVRTVAMYERLFFDLRDRLDVKLTTHNQCFGACLSTGICLSNPDKGWKFMAYYGTKYLFYHMLTMSTGTPAEQEQVGKFNASQLGKLSMQVCSNMTVTAENANDIIRNWHETLVTTARMGSEQQLDEMAASSRILNSSVHLALDSLQISARKDVANGRGGVVQRLLAGRTLDVSLRE